MYIVALILTILVAASTVAAWRTADAAYAIAIFLAYGTIAMILWMGISVVVDRLRRRRRESN